MRSVRTETAAEKSSRLKEDEGKNILKSKLTRNSFYKNCL